MAIDEDMMSDLADGNVSAIAGESGEAMFPPIQDPWNH